MSSRKFTLHVGKDNIIGLKEELNYGVSQRGTKCYLTVGLDSNFNRLKGYVIENTCFVPIDEKTELRREKKRRAIYYMLNELSYVCTITVERSPNGHIYENLVSLYVPNGLYKTGELHCQRVNSLLTEDENIQLFRQQIPYADKRTL